MEKKVIISENLYSKLMNDKDLFEYSDSKNDFYCTIIINTYRFDNTYKQIDSLVELLSGKTKGLAGNEIIEEIKEMKDTFQYKEMLTQIAIEITKLMDKDFPIVGEKKEIFVRETAKTEGELERIISEAGANHASDIFKNLICRYISYPSYIREQIIYSDTKDILAECIRRKTKCKITTKNSEFEIEPFKLLPGSDEYHTYLTCYATQTNGKYERTTMSFKLCSIRSISRVRSVYLFSEEEQETLTNKIKAGGSEYVNGKIEEFQIEMDPRAVRLYDSITKDRPLCIKKEKGRIVETEAYGAQQLYVYTFRCVYFQINNYLKQFSYHVRILNSEQLKKDLFEYYEKAYNGFKNEMDNQGK